VFSLISVDRVLTPFLFIYSSVLDGLLLSSEFDLGSKSLIKQPSQENFRRFCRVSPPFPKEFLPLHT